MKEKQTEALQMLPFYAWNFQTKILRAQVLLAIQVLFGLQAGTGSTVSLLVLLETLKVAN